MRVIVWGINYAPEVTGIAPFNVMLCEQLRARGHEVEMVTTFPYYPGWQKLPEDARRLFRTDLVRGVPVHRCWHYVPAKPSALKRIFHEASFVLTSLWRCLRLRRPDVFVVVSPPLLLGAAAWMAKLLKRAPFVFHIQDLQPDAALGLGMLKGRMLTRLLYGLEAFAYHKAARVSGISPGMLEALRQKGLANDKVVFFPNGVSMPSAAEIPARGAFRRRNGFAAADFIALYSGNLGVKQGLQLLVDAAVHLGDEGIRIVLCGDGTGRDALAEAMAKSGSPHLRLLPLQGEQEYREMLVDADVCLIPQQAGSGRSFFPSKLLSTLAFGRPVLTVADEQSDLAAAVTEGKFGQNVRQGDPSALAEALRHLRRQPALLGEMGSHARSYVERFEKQKVIESFEGVLKEVCEGPPSLVPGDVSSKRSSAGE